MHSIEHTGGQLTKKSSIRAFHRAFDPTREQPATSTEVVAYSSVEERYKEVGNPIPMFNHQHYSSYYRHQILKLFSLEFP
jgi:hypothetical protein